MESRGTAGTMSIRYGVEGGGGLFYSPINNYSFNI